MTPRPRRNHMGEQYGAVAVGKIHEVASLKHTITYDVTWTCCGKQLVMNQKTLNTYRGNPSRCCVECRYKDSPGDAKIARFTRGLTREADTKLIDSPWGKIGFIAPWDGRERVARAWAYE